jgi:hypothetical protein
LGLPSWASALSARLSATASVEPLAHASVQTGAGVSLGSAGNRTPSDRQQFRTGSLFGSRACGSRGKWVEEGHRTLVVLESARSTRPASSCVGERRSGVEWVGRWVGRWVCRWVSEEGVGRGRQWIDTLSLMCMCLLHVQRIARCMEIADRRIGQQFSSVLVCQRS